MKLSLKPLKEFDQNIENHCLKCTYYFMSEFPKKIVMDLPIFKCLVQSNLNGNALYFRL